MGQVVIELPQKVNRLYQIDSEEIGAKILRDLEDLTENPSKTPAIVPPRRHSLKEDLAAVVGIWADREESADEIARAIRDKNNGKI